ncbi:MAG: peptidase M15, partial [Clostridia bacterium]|nr:peptidase M15 [Clostridia bacterium]
MIYKTMPSSFSFVDEILSDAVIDMIYFDGDNFVGERIDGYFEPVAILTVPALNALKKVADEVRGKGYKIKIFDAYRPQCAVNRFISWANENKRTELFSLGYLQSKSSHTRGSTVDLTLTAISTGIDVDM